MVSLNQWLLLNIKKTQQCHIQKLNPNFLFDLHQNMVTKKHQYVTKMTLNVSMRSLRINFITMLQITKYLQRLIYIWNKISKCIMFQCGVYFQSIPSYKAYNFEHFEPIE